MARITVSEELSNKTPAQLDDQFMLITDSQDIKAVCDHFGVDSAEYGSMFVSINDGDYTRVYGCYYTVPQNNDRLYEIKMIHHDL